MATSTHQPIQFSSRAKFVTVLSVVIIAIFLLSQVTHILLPFIWAIITAYIFNPVVTICQRRTKLPRFWWITILYIIGFGLITWVFSVVVPLLTRQFNDLTTALPQWLTQAEEYLNQNESVAVLGITFELEQFRGIETKLFEYLNEAAVQAPTAIPGFLFGLIEGFILTLVYLVVTFYLLLQAETIPNHFYKLIPAIHRMEIKQLVSSIDRVLAAYIRGQFLLILIMSVLSFIALTILQVKFALVIAIATGVLEIIPIVGPYLATGIAATVALFQGTTPFGWEPWFLVLIVILTYFALRQFEDHFIIPKLLGHLVNVHPVIVIFAILAGGSLAGGLGLLIAIPIAAVIKIILVYLYSKLVDSPTPEQDVKEEEEELLDPHTSSDSLAEAT